MASGIARGRVRTTTTLESRKMTRNVEGKIIKVWINAWEALWEAQLRAEILFVVRQFETFEGGKWVRMLSGFWDLSTTTESCKMAAILQLIGWQRHAAYAALIYSVLHWYWISLLWSIDACRNKVSAEQYLMTISRA